MIAEREARLQKIVEEVDRLIREVGPKMIRIAHLRNEAREIMDDIGPPELTDE